MYKYLGLTHELFKGNEGAKVTEIDFDLAPLAFSARMPSEVIVCLVRLCSDMCFPFAASSRSGQFLQVSCYGRE